MIEFDGAYMNAEVYLNGTKLGEHPYGYTAFAFDLTEGLICDGETENVLVVKLIIKFQVVAGTLEVGFIEM